MKKKLAIETLFIIVAAATVFGQDAVSSSRVKAEGAIRSAVYESTQAALTSDVEKYKKHSAQHMLDLYKLMYEEDQGERNEKCFLTNGDQRVGRFYGE